MEYRGALSLLRRDMQELEFQLLKEEGLPPETDWHEIVRRIRLGELEETELVLDWLSLFHNIQAIIQEVNRPPPAEKKTNKSEAAESGLSFFVRRSIDFR